MTDSFPTLPRIRLFDTLDYVPVWEQMKSFTLGRDDQTPDEIWLLQHKPVFTLGQAGKTEHILDPHGIPVIPVDRGGQVTYHGPGQLVVYLMLDVKRRNYGVRRLVDIIEQSIIQVLADYDLGATTRPGAPGVYIDDAKLAALGLRIKKGCSYHGLSLNIDMDLTPFTFINPCGFEGLPVTQLKDLLTDPAADLFVQVREKLLGELLGNL